MTTDSLKKRYFAKLFANFVGLIIGVITQAIVPRGLGPRVYGDFSFLSNFFTQIVSFLDMGTSASFYTKLSQRPKDFGLVSFYFSFMCLVSFLLVMFVGGIRVTGSYAIFFPDQKLFYIYLAAGWGILMWFVKIVNKMADAYGVTVSTEIARIVQKAFGLLLILVLFFTHLLNLTNFFFYNYAVLIFLFLAFVWVIEARGHSMKRSWKLSGAQIKTYTKEFYRYSHPLFVFALVGLIAGILDRWMLQKFSGSVQQGFYGLSYQIGAICFLFTSAMTPLITREFAIAFGKKNLPEMARLFRRYIPMLYTIAAFFACFIVAEAGEVTFIMGGIKFQQATLAVAIMAFYPIHQTYGQLSGSVFYATGQTALYRNIGIGFILIGLPVTYFLIAPSKKFGLDAGATGLAVKMVVLQFIGVNVQLWYNARLLGLRFWRYLGHQIGSVGILLALAFSAKLIIKSCLPVSENLVINFLGDGLLYSILVIALVIFFPVIFGAKREDVKLITNLLARKIKGVEV